MINVPGCPLCDATGGLPVFAGAKFRVIRAQEPGFPAFYRLVWNEHLPEFTDLAALERELCMTAVAEVERLMRTHLNPDKINLAALGNAVPHLHWHIIARFTWDSHFPASVWAPANREVPPGLLASMESLLPALDRAIASRLGGLAGNNTPS